MSLRRRGHSAALSAAQARLLKLQRKIHRSLESEVTDLIGQTPRSIKRYERDFERDFPHAGRLTPATKAEILKAVRASDVTLIADYHPFDQSQRTALRILREAYRPGENWVLGVELASSQHQGVIDAYTAGEITVEEFLEKISYLKEWGFPWRNYAPLFQWARENAVPILGLNRPKAMSVHADKSDRDGTDLADRDFWAAGVLADYFSKFTTQGPKRLRALILYGEMHVASAHLPRNIRQVSREFLGSPLSCVTVHQNHDDIYWRLAAQGLEHSTQAIRLPGGNFCLLSSPPWAKLQSLVSWVEGSETSLVETDYLSLLKSSGDMLTEYLGIKPASYESLTVVGIDQADLLNHLPRRKLSPVERSLVRFHVERNIRVYIPKVGVAYLGAPSQNSAAELAGIHVFRMHARTDALFERTSEDLARQVLESAFGFLCSLLVNPRRKCDLPEDHQARVRALTRGAKPRFPGERESRKLALALLESARQGSSSAFEKLPPRLPAPVLVMAARFAGQIIGLALRDSLLSEKAQTAWVASLARPRMAGPESGFLARLRELRPVFTSARPPRSKNQTL